MRSKIIISTAAAAVLGLAGFAATQGNASVTGSGVIVGRVFEPTAPNYKQTELTVLPNNGADAYGVFVTAECFDVVGNGDAWPNAIAACR
jgi:hypothetical protein